MMKRTRRLLPIGALSLLLATAAVPAYADPLPPAGTELVVSSQPGTLPEGIEVAPNGRVYVTGSGDGDVYVSDPSRPGQLVLLADGATQGRTAALGIERDQRGRLWVAAVDHVDLLDRSGRLLQRIDLPDGGADSYLNDLTVTRDAVYVTDSNTAVVWRIPLTGNEIGTMERWLDLTTVFPYPVYYFYLNGIVASPDGQRLLVASQGLGVLFRIDVATRGATIVDSGDSSFGADGMVLQGDTVYGVLNYEAPEGKQGVYRGVLSADWTTMTVTPVDTTGFDSPTTLALHRGRFYVVNSQLDRAPGTPPYTVSVR
ncbi:SMP-30/gluconolactonase/LRE family protein [Enemella evansiae]|uniref:SMP-30/gluconolactonase/LRE family protein n=1 Tax=Enemella evansiae TaxID=2016499 RepID=UPI000B96D88B|nr:hypothetical protein [Enemella evansiae]OYO00897.1 hypothetical protein CGZ95_09835 [Enemella evansiae]OYO14174.1 hypothetical protein BI335_13365 [Enemella evansiae]TDO91933.1 sugar lactone lactonase YvrE [Enemella evansiae]